MYPFACIYCSMLQHRPLKTSKEIEMNLKPFVKKNVLYWLNHIDFHIQEIFPLKLANLINKLVLNTRLFIGFATLSGNIFCIWKSMWINLYILLYFTWHWFFSYLVIKPDHNMSNFGWNSLSHLMTKPTIWLCAQRRLRSAWASAQSDQIRPVWSESSLSTWRNLGSLPTHWAHSEDSDQTGRMPRLIWVFAGPTSILMVLSWCGSVLFSDLDFLAQ